MFSRGGSYYGGAASPAGYESGVKRLRSLDYYGSAPSLQSSVMYGSPFGGSPYYAQPRAFPVVRLRGLPFDCTVDDVTEFFAGLDLVDVLLLHKSDRFTGEAFCVFGAPVQVDYAMQRNLHNMGRRYIEVFRSNKQEYYEAIASEVGQSRNENGGSSHVKASGKYRARDNTSKDKSEHTGVLKLRGLPFSTSSQEIMDFFGDFDIKEEDVHVCYNSEGKATGEAYVVFESAEESKQAMRKDRMTIGPRYVELFPSTQEALDSAKQL